MHTYMHMHDLPQEVETCLSPETTLHNLSARDITQGEREGGTEGGRTEEKQLNKHITCGCQYIPTMRHMRGTQEREREEWREEGRKENN